jgi:hypothetical protein
VAGRPPPYPLVIGSGPDSETLEFDVVLERRLPDSGETWEHVQELEISVPLTVVGPMAEVLTPVENEDLDRALVSAFSPGVTKWAGGRSPVRIQFDRRYVYTMGLENTSIGACVEILHNGDPARRLDLWWTGRPEPGGRDYGWRIAHEDVPRLMGVNEADGRWELRVRGDPAIALRAGIASSYWAGEFTVPLVVNVNEMQPVAPVQDWWIESP